MLTIELEENEEEWLTDNCLNILGSFKRGGGNITIENYKSFNFNKGDFCDMEKDEYNLIIAILDKIAWERLHR